MIPIPLPDEAPSDPRFLALIPAALWRALRGPLRYDWQVNMVYGPLRNGPARERFEVVYSVPDGRVLGRGV